MDLREVLSVTRLTDSTFRSQPPGTGFQFGGLTMAAALQAAAQTVAPEMGPKSLHTYFLRPGEWGTPVDLEIEELSNGRTFAARTVSAKQNDKTLAVMTTSFNSPRDGVEWQVSDLDGIAGPDDLSSIPVTLPVDDLIEVRPLSGSTALLPAQPLHPYWARWLGTLEDANAQAAALAFISDYLVVRAIQKGGPEHDETTVRTLDQSVWFHHPADLEDWLLFSTEPVSVSRGTGLTHGSVHTRAGLLVATFTQEVIFL